MDFILDASLALQWCFEDEATAESEAVLTQIQNETNTAWAPDIWPYEMLNGIGKGISRGRIERQKGFLLWQEIRTLPVRIVGIPVNEALLELALQYNLAVYDASYLSLAITRNLSLATGDGKLAAAAQSAGLDIIRS